MRTFEKIVMHDTEEQFRLAEAEHNAAVAKELAVAIWQVWTEGGGEMPLQQTKIVLLGSSGSSFVNGIRLVPPPMEIS